MKALGVSILLLLAITASFSKWMLIASYALNKSYIAAELCVNKAKPKSCCAGKCYLTRQMNKEESGSSDNSTVLKSKTGIEVISSKSFFSSLQVAATYSNTSYVVMSDNRQITMPRSIFHPPGA